MCYIFTMKTSDIGKVRKATLIEEKAKGIWDSIDTLSKLRIVWPGLVKFLVISRVDVRHGVVLLNMGLGSVFGTLCVKLGILPRLGPIMIR
jgi:hypothetical protein